MDQSPADPAPDAVPDVTADAAATPYQVLARKYRPGHFRDLIGQEAMVRTLTNAFAHDRIAHAFVLTGVRGVGKTTTARIIAKGLNCEAVNGPTVDPCGICEACRSIAEGRNVDVLEMDAASNTSVNDVREIIESVRYRAASARYKVYIVDEVHMLSTSAFNALLKTLEEPPEHVKFIFATTEIRKVPVTVLSRCQRFDLRRIEPQAMIAHLSGIADKEGKAVGADALALLARAAEGSVRDALSLLDQAIAQGSAGSAEVGVPIGADQVRGMLGLADRGRVIDLFEAIMKGDAKAALAELSEQYADGVDPAAVLRDLAELTHWVSVVKIDPAVAADPTVPDDERRRGTDLAERLSMRVLARAWQMLLKAIEEVAVAPSAMMAAEMAVIRLTHVAELPPPEEIVRRLTFTTGPGAASGAPSTTPSSAPTGGDGQSGGGGTGSGGAATALAAVAVGAPLDNAPPSMRQSMPDSLPRAEAEPETAARLARFRTFEDVVALIAETRDMKLLVEVETGIRLVGYRAGMIEFNPAPNAPRDLAGRLSERLRLLTGARWSVMVTTVETGRPSIAEARAAEKAARTAEAAEHPLVLAALAAFPGATIQDVRPLAAASPDTADPADPHGETYLAPVAEADDIGPDHDLLDRDDPFGEEI